MRALLYGLGAAIAGAIVMGIVAWWGWQLALLSIFAGQLIAKAMKHATGQKGSQALQIWAVGLTYFACTVSFAPALLKSFLDSAAEKQKKAGKKRVEEPESQRDRGRSRHRTRLATAVIVGISLVSPFLMIGARDLRNPQHPDHRIRTYAGVEGRSGSRHPPART